MPVYIVYYIDDSDYYHHPEIRVYVGCDEKMAKEKLKESMNNHKAFGHLIEIWVDGTKSATQEYDPACY